MTAITDFDPDAFLVVPANRSAAPAERTLPNFNTGVATYP
jgi:hypothetical protein